MRKMKKVLVTGAAENIRRMAFQRQNIIRCIGLEQPELTQVDTVALAT